jgi:hypothetical protein
MRMDSVAIASKGGVYEHYIHAYFLQETLLSPHMLVILESQTLRADVFLLKREQLNDT